MRIHFTPTDLARTRLTAEPSWLTVTTFSLFWLTHRPGLPELDLWRRAVRARPRPAGRPLLGELAATAPTHPIPRLLRPQPGPGTLEDELDRLMSTPRHVVRADLEFVARHRALPGWVRGLADADRDTFAALAGSVRDHHRLAVAPYRRGLAAVLAADHAARTRQLREGGIERLLDTLHPRMRWRPPVLEVDSSEELDYHLGGRGLLLAPSAFSTYAPCDPGEEQPTLYYEVAHDPAHRPLLTGVNGPHGGLAALLGHSRAAVLEVIAEGASTGQIARRAGLSAASASEHATILRRAGLVATRRSGRVSHHSLTPLGAELLLHATAEGTRPGRADPLGR